MANPARASFLKYLLVAVTPLAVALLQSTAGDASVPVYLTMALPMLFWSLLPASAALYAAIKRRWLWVLINSLVLLVVVVFHAGYCFGRQGVAYGSTLRVMTFNVQIFSRYSIEQVARVVRDEKPDVLCLQEMPTTGQEFASLLKDYHFKSAGRLAVATRLPVRTSHVVQLRGDARRALVVDLQFNGQPIRIINVHLQHLPSDDLTKIGEASRNLMIESNALKQLVSLSTTPTIVAGDLNSIPQGRVNRMLRAQLTDCFAATAKGFGFTIPANFPMRRIDYIYCGFGFVPVTSKVHNAIASDHRAVVAEVSAP